VTVSSLVRCGVGREAVGDVDGEDGTKCKGMSARDVHPIMDRNNDTSDGKFFG